MLSMFRLFCHPYTPIVACFATRLPQKYLMALLVMAAIGPIMPKPCPPKGSGPTNSGLWSLGCDPNSCSDHDDGVLGREEVQAQAYANSSPGSKSLLPNWARTKISRLSIQIDWQHNR